MAQFPTEIEALVQRGIAAAKEGKNGIAQQLLHKAVELAPTHEQAWLWLSGVEDTDQKKLEALEKVLSINPVSTLARQGIERLTQPKQIDLAQIAAVSAAPAPARAAKSANEPPPIPPPMPPLKPPTQPLATPIEASQLSTNEAVVTAPPRAESELEARGIDALEDLKPAMERAKKKRSFLPRMSEMVIMAGLLVLLLGAIIGLRFVFNPNKYDVVQERVNQTNRERTAQAQSGQPETQVPVIIETAVPAVEPTIAPPPANTLGSRSYQLQMGGAAISEDQKSVAVSVVLTNPLQRQLTFSNVDFAARNGTNAALRLDPTQSTLLASKTIPPNGTVSGTLVFVGDVSRTPLTLVWQPQGGGVRQEIPIQ